MYKGTHSHRAPQQKIDHEADLCSPLALDEFCNHGLRFSDSVQAWTRRPERGDAAAYGQGAL